MGRAPYNGVLTHGFTLDEKGMKMSKSLGNTVAPEDVIRQYGADILRLWVAQSDYTADLRIGPEILKGTADSYRRLRNTMRFLLGALDGFTEAERVDPAEMPELERWVLHRLAELDTVVREGYGKYDFQHVFQQLFQFCTVDLSAVYFDIRKDALYCDAAGQPAPPRRPQRARHPVPPPHHLARPDPRLHHGGCLARTLPRRGRLGAPSGLPRHARHLARRGARRQMAPHPRSPPRRHRRPRSRAPREAHRRRASRPPRWSMSPIRRCAPPSKASISPISASPPRSTLTDAPAAEAAFRLDEIAGVAVVPGLAEGEKCARCWKILPDVGTHSHPGTCARCDAALG